jgi:hypothetical protein
MIDVKADAKMGKKGRERLDGRMTERVCMYIVRVCGGGVNR